ncbi:MAG: glycosyltransferase family 4 protein [Thermoleophilia bacterium]|nr:glycosyltransferase family 4 protein [Thermoleophilia bacterium]
MHDAAGAATRRRRTVVLIDARMARRRRTGGARYITGLIRALDAHRDTLDIRPVHGPPPLPRRNALTSLGNLLLDLAWTHVVLPLLAVRHRADVIHATFNWGPWVSPRPVVVTIHDLSWEVLPEAYPAGFRRYARTFTRATARRARAVIAVSQATADDLVRIYGIDPRRVRVIHTGITPRTPSGGPREAMVLHVGEFEPRKRVPEIIAAHAAYRAAAPANPPPCRLVLAGAGGADEDAVASACGAAAAGCERLGYVDDATLDDLYRRAALVVNNSAYEGFGLPVAEAMSAGCAVLVADTPALREAGGPEALVVDGPGQEALTRALGAALADRDALAERGRRGREHAATFTWETCAAAHAEAYRAASR